MSSEAVTFFSGGVRLAGTLKLPENGNPPWPVVVQGPGWLGLRDAKLYRPYHEGLLAAGIAVLVFDYRGFGDSEGHADLIDPASQVEDWRNAISYVETRPEVHAGRIGAFGSGGTGGGSAVMVGGLDDRVKVVVAQNAIADGRDWLRRMRREYEWLEFLASLREDARVRATTGQGRRVDPRDGIMIATPERKTTTLKSDVDGRVPTEVQLASAEAIFAYKPIEVVDRIAPRALMLICTENDAVTPEEHSYQLYERAGGPKRLVVQTGTTHYAAYEHYREVVNPLVTEWFERYLCSGEVLVHDGPAEATVLRLDRSPA